MKLNHLTDKTLLSATLYWVNQEREVLDRVLWHLREVDKRKLYCEARCGSLFEYCVKILKYSEGQASRRVSATRLLKELPHITEDIRSGAVNLTQLNQVRKFFEDELIKDPAEKDKIIMKIKGKTTRETENLLHDLKKDDTPKKVNLTLLEETVLELRKLQAQKAHSLPNMDLLLNKMCEEVRVLWDPTLIIKKRKISEGNSRYVQVQARAEVWKRDQGKCRNCGSSYALEIDHVKPFAVGGKTSIENLRLLCRNCNQRAGSVYFNERNLSKDFIFSSSSEVE